ncbi:MAG: GNAT family N-acetyltransferase [Leptolyngbyaceae cyanobacterium SM2_5_2]|nr:GNAT family N-acetyltransferase [Leptolyngbyaceae cyanobacterium SM2_5_2]
MSVNSIAPDFIVFTNPQPTLHTQRLILRPFLLTDAPLVAALAGEPEVAAMTLSIPYPYPVAQAKEWILQRPQAWQDGQAVNYAITQRDDILCGSVSLGVDRHHNHAELGYWIGKPYWGQGYATEAAALIAFGFDTLKLNRLNATHFSDNPASGRVMEKLGMTYEGHRRRFTLRAGKYRDIKLYGLLQEDWRQAHTSVSSA